MKKIAAVYSIFVGMSMILMWMMFYLTGSIPELATEPARILLHIAAEAVTALGLIMAGYGLLAAKGWGHSLYLAATGALLYTLIQSPGYFLQQGEFAFVAMFAGLLLMTFVLLFLLLRRDELFG